MRCLLYLVFISLTINHCIWDSWDEFYAWAKEWQKKQIKERYGSGHVDKDQIEKWEKQIIEYEEVIDEKIKASNHLGSIHRKLGEAYAELGSYEQCIEHLKKSLKYGHLKDDVFFTLGLCEGNLAQKNNWDHKYTKKAEKTFLKVLNLNPQYHKAKFQLGLIYFFGFGKNNRYRVLNEYITVKQKDYRKKSIRLLEEYQALVEGDPRVYFLLSKIYKIMGKTERAISETKDLIKILEKKYPDNYKDTNEYRSAAQNLESLTQGYTPK